MCHGVGQYFGNAVNLDFLDLLSGSHGMGAWFHGCGHVLDRGCDDVDRLMRVREYICEAPELIVFSFFSSSGLLELSCCIVMVLLNWLSVSFWACAALAAPAPSPQGGYGSSSPTVTVKNGTLEGVHSEQYDQDYFLGIPFAQPPVGALRFRVPQSINTSWSETRSAKDYSAACVGYGSDQWPYPSLSEDCLYLNVVRPSGYEKEKLPIAFWIHGGGLYEGSGIDQRYNLSFMVQRSVEIGKPIIGVSINYRLSMWGFVTGEEVVETGNANIGFRDQRLAMHWVQENIEAFGGRLLISYSTYRHF